MSAYDDYNRNGYTRAEIAEDDDDYVYVHAADDMRAAQKVEGN